MRFLAVILVLLVFRSRGGGEPAGLAHGAEPQGWQGQANFVYRPRTPGPTYEFTSGDTFGLRDGKLHLVIPIKAGTRSDTFRLGARNLPGPIQRAR